MRSFQWAATLDPVPGHVVKLLARVDRAAGAEGQYRDQLPHLMTGLAESARIESITASSAIEGVFVDSVRMPGLASGSTTRFRNRSEAEFAGYRTDTKSDNRVSDSGFLHPKRAMPQTTPM